MGTAPSTTPAKSRSRRASASRGGADPETPAPPPASAVTPGTATTRGRSRRASTRYTETEDGPAAAGTTTTTTLLSDDDVPATNTRSRRARRSPAPAAATPTVAKAEPEAEAYAGTEPLSGGEGAAPTTGRRGRARTARVVFAPGTVSPATATPPAASSAAAPKPVVAGDAGVVSPITSPLASPLPGVSPAEHGVDAAGPEYTDSQPTSYPPVPRLSWDQIARNTLLIITVTLPSIYFYRQLRHGCRSVVPLPAWAVDRSRQHAQITTKPTLWR